MFACVQKNLISMGLTDEQKRKMEENRQKALKLLAAKQSTPSVQSSIGAKTTHGTFYGKTQTASKPPLSNCLQPPIFNQRSSITPASHASSHHAQSTIRQNKYPASSGPKISRQKDLPAPAFTGLSPEKKSLVKGKCCLLDKTRFVVDVRFCPPLIELFKSMETKQYDSKIQSLRDYARIEPLPRSVLKAFDSALQGKETERHIPPVNIQQFDPYLASLLLPFQREGVEFAVWRGGRVLIADDMGLGKTIQALAIARYYHSEWPVLIITPSSVRFAWKQELLDKLECIREDKINVVTSGRECCTSGLINILSYDLMARKQKELLSKAFKVIIMDESHLLKNSKTARAKAAMPLLKQAKRVILLSGTPALSRPAELFTQISAVDPNMFPHFKEYGVRYCDGKEMPWGWDFSGSSNLQELQLVLGASIMIRRLKSEVISQLPSKSRTMVLLDPSSIKITQTMRASHTLVDKMKGSDRRGALLEYFHETASAKIPAVRVYILELLEADRKFLVFAHHQEMLDALEQALYEKSVGYMRIDGSTQPEQRQANVDSFQNNSSLRVALLSITAANAGLNLTAASLVVFSELFWNPGILVQAEDRAHRIGQQDSVSVQYLVAKGTADDSMWPLVQQKLDVLSKAGLSKDSFTDAKTKCLQDTKQTSLMKYFSELQDCGSAEPGHEDAGSLDAACGVDEHNAYADLSDADWGELPDEFFQDTEAGDPCHKKVKR